MILSTSNNIQICYILLTYKSIPSNNSWQITIEQPKSGLLDNTLKDRTNLYKVVVAMTQGE